MAGQVAESSAPAGSTTADLNENDRGSHSTPRRADFRGDAREPYQKPFPVGMHPSVIPVPAYGMQNGYRGSMLPADGMLPGMGMGMMSPGMVFPFHPGVRMVSGPVPMPVHGFPDHMMGRQYPPRPFMIGQHLQHPLGDSMPIVNAGMDGGFSHHSYPHRHHPPEGRGGQNHRREFSSGSGGSGGSADVRSSTSGVSVEEMKELEDLLSKLNPLAKEFVPPGTEDGVEGEGERQGNQGGKGKKKNGVISGKRKGGRSGRAQREDSIKRTVYVSDIDQSVTEEQLASLFLTCGQVVDCRICGDPNSVLRFAFVEFVDEEGARNALSLAGTVLGYYPVRVLPSKTAIIPVNPTFLPRSEDDRDLCSRTVYCANIDKKVTQADVKLFFESLCGEISKQEFLSRSCLLSDTLGTLNRIHGRETTASRGFSSLDSDSIRRVYPGGKCNGSLELQRRDFGLVANQGQPLQDAGAPAFAAPPPQPLNAFMLTHDEKRA